MPTYDFRCPNGHEFEKFYRKISDAASELPCPECSAMAQRRVSGGAGLMFKGSGFYLTDYGKDAHRKPVPTGPANDGAKGADAKADAGGDAKGDSSATSPGAAKGETQAGGSKPVQPKGGAGSSGASGE